MRVFIHLGRGILAAITLFELLNIANIFTVPLDFTWAGLFITLMASWLLLELGLWYAKKQRVDNTFGIVYVVVITALLIDMCGDIFHLYSSIEWYDQMAHTVGGVAVATGVAILFSKMRLRFFSLTIIAFTALGGALYEIEEYLEDFFRGSNRLGDGPDTANDLMLTITGGIIVTVMLWIYQSQKKCKKKNPHANS